VNAAWPPGSRKGCGHAQCRRYTIASAAALIGADAVITGSGVTAAGQAHPVIVVTAGGVIAAAGVVLALWPHPRSSDDAELEALVRAVLEEMPDHVPAKWTGDTA